MKSVFAGGLARAPKQTPKIIPKKYTLWSALRNESINDKNEKTSENQKKKNDNNDDDATSQIPTPPFVDLASGKEVHPEEFRKAIAAICLLFLDLSDECKNAKSIYTDFLKKVDQLQIPTRVIIVPVQQHLKYEVRDTKLTQEDYEKILDGLPAGLALANFEDPRVHILASFRQDYSSSSMPLLATYDAYGNQLNKNAFFDMFQDLQSNPQTLSGFPYRSGIITESVRLFRSEFVDPALVENTCVILHKLATPANDKQSQLATLLFQTAVKKYEEARGEAVGANALRFFETRSLDQVTIHRKENECRKGHELKKKGQFDYSTCNGCGTPGLNSLQSCIPCNFDLCETCYKAKVQIAHPDVQLMELLCNEFSRSPPESLCVIAHSYESGLFFCDRIGTVENDDDLLAFFYRVGTAKFKTQ